ncbi:hypothetical protein JW933_04010 [candidate division FCPU426 bacterium]|nr:hypothetical protein [candidate division FCPU426 bacterium]
MHSNAEAEAFTPMSADGWTQLVTRVDALIRELRNARAEAKKWKARAVELERLKSSDERPARLDLQAKERELERYRKERKKMLATITRLVDDLEQAQKRILENLHA